MIFTSLTFIIYFSYFEYNLLITDYVREFCQSQTQVSMILSKKEYTERRTVTSTKNYQ